MSANANVLQGTDAITSSKRESPLLCETAHQATNRWNPEDFAREQILSLVRRVFFANSDRPAQQVVFSGVERNRSVADICEEVARILAQQTVGHVAVVKAGLGTAEETCIRVSSLKPTSIKTRSTRIGLNLWRIPSAAPGEFNHETGAGLHWLRFLEQLRNEFKFVVIDGPAAGTSSEAALLGQLTDGLILVLDARSTRRATAQKAKEALDAAKCRILGTMLIERSFPIPEQIYRRL
jgi:hypothetical protein